MAFTTAALRAALAACVPAEATGLVVALSGGEDSTSLLVAAAAIAGGGGPPLRAAHIDHGLQPAAVEFRRAAAAQCERWRVPLAIVAAQVKCDAGQSLEAAARAARYAALERELRPGECLLTAHHREDQAETLLLQALRGAGPKGLAGMPALKPFGRGWHARPMLDFSRRELREYLAAAGAAAAGVDPMNADTRFDRVYLRQTVWPLLERRWPGASLALARAAGHLAVAQELLDDLADGDLADVGDGETLAVPRLRGLGVNRQLNVLRRWLGERGASMPPAARLQEALRQIMGAAADHVPAAIWADAALRRYQDRIFLTAAELPKVGAPLSWEFRAQPLLRLGPGLGQLRAVAADGGFDLARLPQILSVRRRAGGETLRPAPGAATQTVQHLCQAQRVLPWMRDALPFIFAGEDLIAVGDLWAEAAFSAAAAPAGLQILWESPPNIW